MLKVERPRPERKGLRLNAMFHRAYLNYVERPRPERKGLRRHVLFYTSLLTVERPRPERKGLRLNPVSGVRTYSLSKDHALNERD